MTQAPHPENEMNVGRQLRRWFAISVVVIVVWMVWMILRPLRMPIAWAAVLSFLLYPLQVRLTSLPANRRSAAAGVIKALTPVAIIAPVELIGIAFAQQVAALSDLQQKNEDVFNHAHW